MYLLSKISEYFLSFFISKNKTEFSSQNNFNFIGRKKIIYPKFWGKKALVM